MKKYVFMLTWLMLVLPLLIVACSDNDEAESTDTPVVEQSPEESGEPAPEESGEPAPEESGEPAPEESGEPAPEESVEPAPEESGEPAPEESVEPAPEESVEPAPEESGEPAPEESAEPPTEQAIEQPTEQPAASSSTLDGQWELNLVVNQWLFNDGQTQDAGNIGARIIANLTQSDNFITGQFQSVTIEGFDDSCEEAQINGSVQDEQVEWTMSYTGECCNGFNIRFAGTRNPESTELTGNFEPVGTPPAECRPWIAQITGTKQGGTP